jgi:hypothetical protein
MPFFLYGINILIVVFVVVRFFSGSISIN